MATSILWNTMNDLANFQREVNRVLGAVDGQQASLARQTPGMHLGSDDENLYLELVIPGVAPESLELQVEDDELRITGLRAGFSEGENGAHWLRRERFDGRFTRRVRLPLAVDRDKIAAEYKHGILTVTLPKAAEAKPRQIEVRVG